MMKNKIVFVLALFSVLLFIAAYSVLTFSKKETQEITTGQIPLPDLEDTQKEYDSKLEALDALKEEKTKTAPSVYPEHMVDDKGFFNPDYMEYEKHRIIDSIYNQGKIDYASNTYRNLDGNTNHPKRESTEKPLSIPGLEDEPVANTMEMGLAHQLFFASKPKQNAARGTDQKTNIAVRVNGTHIVRDGHRIEMRVMEDTKIAGRTIRKNSLVYGFVKIRPNRVLIELNQIDHKPVSLKAHDFQDGNEGIYIENNLKGEIRDQVIHDAIGEINIPGLPQVGGLKRLFQKDNRRIKVEIADNYLLLLKNKEAITLNIN